MPKLELSLPEADLLHEIVQEWLFDLRTEIGHTDNLEYRERLKRQEAVLRDILDRLGAPVTASSHP
jgi:hypothetical protein